MQAAMDRMRRMERIVEDIGGKRAEMVELDRKRQVNRECLGAFRRGEVQSNTKLWMSIGDNMLKLPRKNIIAMVEGEQVSLNKLIDENRQGIKTKIRELFDLSGGSQIPLPDVDPYVVGLLVKEERKREGVIDEDEDEDDV